MADTHMNDHGIFVGSNQSGILLWDALLALALVTFFAGIVLSIEVWAVRIEHESRVRYENLLARRSAHHMQRMHQVTGEALS